MFKRNKELQSLVDSRTRALENAENKIGELEQVHKDLRTEIEYEHLENYRNHRKLLEIERLLKQQDYNSIDNLKNKIRTILNKKELSIDFQSIR